MSKPIVLIVMDGWGCAPDGPFNSLTLAKTPVLDGLTATYPNTEIAAHGSAVGLPDGQMGNSEVGHLNLGAGRIVKQDLVLIDDAIKDKSFQTNAVFKEGIAKIKKANGRAHVMGLCSPGGVHSSLDHLYALVDLLHASGLEVFLHALLDGRDTPPRSARGYLTEIESRILGKAKVATVVGRFYTMDRDQRWERVERGYRAHVYGEGQHHQTADEAIAAAYDAGENDEFVTPRVMVDREAKAIGTISSGDGIFFFNFRADRAREITTALTVDDFDSFDRGRRPQLSSYVCMTEYKDTLGLPVAFPPIALDKILGEVLAERGLRQLRAAETEKYAHVTFFFNGGVETPFTGESRKLIPSPKEVATYDLKPQMSAREVADAVLEHLASEQIDFVLINFANGDMVGHTGVLEAAVRAAETVDEQVGRIVTVVQEKGGSVIVTADHGNLEKMRDQETGQPHTAHTTNPVPFILVDDRLKDARLSIGGSLRDVAPTVLDLLHIEPPPEMTGKTLIVR